MHACFGELLAHLLDGDLTHLVGFAQLDGRHAVLHGQHPRKIGLGQHATRYKSESQARAGLLLLPEGSIQVFSADQPFAKQKFADLQTAQ